MNRCSPTPSTSARWISTAVNVLAAVTTLCLSVAATSAAQAPTAQSPSKQQAAATHVPGIPDLPNVVTVLPFLWKENFDENDKTRVIFPAEVDGVRGNFELDLGAIQLFMNRTFLQPSPTGGVDSVTDANRIPEPPPSRERKGEAVRVKMRIGTLAVDFDDSLMTAPNPQRFNAFLNHWWNNFSYSSAPILGNIGVMILEQFETIVDYTHKRVVLIRLDKDGHRMAKVPAYTPKWSAPLVALLDTIPPGRLAEWWAVHVQVGAVSDTFFFDTGAPTNTMTRKRRASLATYMTDGTLHFSLAGRTFDVDRFYTYNKNMLGYPFLSSLGVVGFNHRTHQFILYR